jgi:amino-acid N-acetyltransferase
VILVEVFSDQGIGTMVHANVYQSIRPMRSDEVATVYRLMQPLVERGVLVERDPDDIAAVAGDFVVHETDGRIHGCGALHEFANGTGEIAGIAIEPAYEEFGIGRHIVLYLIEEARRRGLRAVFALTTRTSDWFERIGFVRASVDELPEEKQRRYNLDRRSIVLRYEISEIA